MPFNHRKGNLPALGCREHLAAFCTVCKSLGAGSPSHTPGRTQNKGHSPRLHPNTICKRSRKPSKPSRASADRESPPLGKTRKNAPSHPTYESYFSYFSPLRRLNPPETERVFSLSLSRRRSETSSPPSDCCYSSDWAPSELHLTLRESKRQPGRHVGDYTQKRNTTLAGCSEPV